MEPFANSRRWVSFVGLCAFLLAIASVACSSSEEFKGTELRPPQPAAPFELQNQFGRQVNLSDYAGKVTVLTFLYTNCPNVCPIVTSQLRDTHEMLGAADVAFVAISVDPERDTVQEAHAYSDKWKMTHNWDFLVEDRERLAPIWEAYYIDPANDDHSQGSGASSVKTGGVTGLQQDIVDRYLVIHTTPVYLIDAEGMRRVVFTPPFDTEDLAHDIRLLID